MRLFPALLLLSACLCGGAAAAQDSPASTGEPVAAADSSAAPDRAQTHQAWLQRFPESERRVLPELPGQPLIVRPANRSNGHGKILLLPDRSGSRDAAGPLVELRVLLSRAGWEIWLLPDAPTAAEQLQPVLTAMAASPGTGATTLVVAQGASAEPALKALASRQPRVGLVLLSSDLLPANEALVAYVKEGRAYDLMDIIAERDWDTVRNGQLARRDAAWPEGVVQFRLIAEAGHDFLRQRGWLARVIHGYGLRRAEAGKPAAATADTP